MGSDLGAFSSIFVPEVAVARRGKWRGLDQVTSDQEIEDFIGNDSRETDEVVGEGLARAVDGRAQFNMGFGKNLREGEQHDVCQLQVRKIPENRIGEHTSLSIEQRGCGVC